MIANAIVNPSWRDWLELPAIATPLPPISAAFQLFFGREAMLLAYEPTDGLDPLLDLDVDQVGQANRLPVE